MSLVKHRDLSTRNRKKKEDLEDQMSDSELIQKIIQSNKSFSLSAQTRNKLFKVLDCKEKNQIQESRLTTFGQFAGNFFFDLKLGNFQLNLFINLIYS